MTFSIIQKGRQFLPKDQGNMILQYIQHVTICYIWYQIKIRIYRNKEQWTWTVNWDYPNLNQNKGSALKMVTMFIDTEDYFSFFLDSLNVNSFVKTNIIPTSYIY